MAKKETERSLRWFLLIAGGVTVALALHDVNTLTRLSHAPTRMIAPLWYAAVSHLIIGGGLFLAGIRLSQALLTGVRWIQQLALFAGLSLVVELAWTYHVFHIPVETAYQQGAFIGTFLAVGVRLLALALVYTRVGRLSAEARTRAASATFE